MREGENQQQACDEHRARYSNPQSAAMLQDDAHREATALRTPTILAFNLRLQFVSGSGPLNLIWRQVHALKPALWTLGPPGGQIPNICLLEVDGAKGTGGEEASWVMGMRKRRGGDGRGWG
eukprot:9476581-Pyramimonas_sp.AAC.6